MLEVKSDDSCEQAKSLEVKSDDAIDKSCRSEKRDIAWKTSDRLHLKSDTLPLGISLEVHTTFCVQISGKCRVACKRVVSHGQSSIGWYEHFRPLKREAWTSRLILTPRCNWMHAALRASMQCDFFRPFGHNSILRA